ncbi:hypothetical protein [Caulobacter flavus]|uniref:hypothetical protein n=1 Tax=Caulobacter flavus TaxID=1679497 RepID=UPI0011AF1D3C|nr:hypothetical protein [Caulobacter flavus]
MTHAPPAPTAKRPAKADLDEAVAWLRILWKIPISNEDLEGFFRWSRDRPAAAPSMTTSRAASMTR